MNLKRTVTGRTWGIHIDWVNPDGTPFWLEASNVQRPAIGSTIRAGRGAFPDPRIVVVCHYTGPGSRVHVVYYAGDQPMDRLVPDPAPDLSEWYAVVRACRKSGEAYPVIDWMQERGPTSFARLLQSAPV